MDETRKDKLLTWVIGIAFFAFAGWGVTYIPVVSDTMPSLITAPTPTVDLDVRDLSLNELEGGHLPAGFLDDACKQIPFLLRPLASKPSAARVAFSNDGSPIGEATYDCRTRALVDSKMF
jgi:hypothetical protein